MVEEIKVKEGYKKTEVGIIPEDWKVNTLGNYSNITKLAGFEYTQHFNSYKDGGDIIVLRGTNITNNRLDLSNIKMISSEISQFLKRSQLSKDDLVFAYVGTIGPVYLIKENNKYHLGPNTAKITVGNQILPDYIFIYFQSEGIKKEIEHHTSIGAQPSLSMEKIRKFNIIVPPIKEQKAIATVLTDIDNLINSLEKLILKKKKIKQGTMQQLLTGKKRLDGFTGEWEIKELGRIAEIKMGQSPLSQYYNTSSIGLPLIQGNADMHNRKTIIRNYSSQITKQANKGDIIMTVRAPVGNIGNALFDCCIGRGVCSIRYSNNYLYHYLIFIENNWSNLSKGSTFDSVNSNDVKGLNIKLPSLKEQKAIAQILSDMDLEIEKLEEKLSKYKTIKQGMMQELLTGRIRLI